MKSLLLHGKNTGPIYDKCLSYVFTLGCEKVPAQRCDIYSRYISSGGYSNAEGLLPHITFVTGGEEKLDGVCLALVKKTQLSHHHHLLLLNKQTSKQINTTNATNRQTNVCLALIKKTQLFHHHPPPIKPKNATNAANNH